MIAVYYPYYAASSVWEELRYSLRSLDKNLKEEFEVWIVGDLPEWVQKVRHIPHKRDNSTKREPLLFDANSKLKKFLMHKDSPESFIRMYDDIYLLQDITVKDLEVMRYTYERIDDFDLSQRNSGGSTWHEQVIRTLLYLRYLNFTTYMTETHCPELFEKGKLLDILCSCDFIERRFLVSTLYFNMWNHFENKIFDRKAERALFYGTEDEFSYSSESIEDKIKGKKFLNHNDAGLNDELKEVIMRIFQEKSRFER